MENKKWLILFLVLAFCFFKSQLLLFTPYYKLTLKLRNFPPITLTGYCYLTGALSFLFTITLFPRETVPVFNNSVLIAVLYAGILNSAVNFGFITWAMKIVTPVTVTASWPLQVLFVMLLSIVFFDYTVSVPDVFGSVMIIVGMMLVIYTRVED
eukprot:Lithocolla_globosa_v1_NODE_576_length_3702_cov_18.492185.p3 type:complete len:154 gc:universal NODE_576_length_3702_cov_18.492185:3105-3566(+)